MNIKVKNLRGEDLDYGVAPPNPDMFHEQFYLDVECEEQRASIRIGFNLITIGKLAELNGSIWAWACLVVPRFSWDVVFSIISSEVSSLIADTWEETVKNLAIEFYIFEESTGIDYPKRVIRGRKRK